MKEAIFGLVAGAGLIAIVLIFMVVPESKNRGGLLDCIYQEHEIKLCEEILGFTWVVKERG